MAKMVIPVQDYSDEASTAKITVDDAITDPNFTLLFNAVDGVLIGAIGQSTLNLATNKDAGPGGLPASTNAQREMKWLCRYQDDVTLKKHRLEIPTADSALLAANSDFMDLTAGAGLTLKTQFELQAEAPETGNAVTLVSVELVGRNL